MTFFESVIHSLGTTGTGGFGIKADSISSYSAYSQWVIAIFMFLSAINFNLFFLVIVGKIKNAIKSNELICYLIMVLVSIIIVSVSIYPEYKNIEEVLRLSTFQVTSTISTTGYSTANFDLWPQLAKTILIFLMFVGGCAGSTAGGFKVTRIVILFKRIGKELKKIIHPRSVEVIKTEGKVTKEELKENNIGKYIAQGAILIIAVVFIVIGVANGGAADVLQKAVNICRECIGIG